MGFQDSLYELGVPYASEAAVDFADRSMEAVCYHAYWASTELAAERGRYSSYHGSLWDRGILPIDSVDLLAEQRGGYVELDRSATLDWDVLRQRITQHGMRNSNCVAIRADRDDLQHRRRQCVDRAVVRQPVGQVQPVREFTIVNEYLVRDLKKLGLWDDVMVMDLKHFDGSLRRIDRVPADLKALYATAFEIETQWLVEAAARRQKWIDQAQSLNIYMAGASGRSSMKPTSSRGCAVSRPPTTCARSARRTRRNRP
jgi:ribonucleoside-diphosphate reductase alpha chain